jgi:UDP-glucose 6-dehydrogenase
MEIRATPMSHSTLIEFDVNKVKQVYYGRLDNCRCGCAGDYFKPGEDDAEITKALKLLNEYSNSPIDNVSYDRFTYKDPSQNELYFEIQTETRDFAGWDSVEGTHDAGDYDPDYHESDEGDVGYAFYIQD